MTLTTEQRQRHNEYQRKSQLERYHRDPAHRQAMIDRAKRDRKLVAALTTEQLERRRTVDAARQARHRAAKKAAALAAP
jgi:hypothetical protein